MYARLIAYVCLSQFALSASLPGTSIPRKQSLIVFLKSTDQQDPSIMLAMRDEVRKLLKPTGYEIEFRSDSGGSPVSGRVVVTEFKGQCLAAAHQDDTLRSPDLATTAISNGHILPFSQVHCAAISRLLTPELIDKHVVQRQILFGRSLGRIVAHEIYHILADDTHHEAHGIAKSHFSSKDLLSSHFEFNESSIERMSDVPQLPVHVGGGGE